MWEQHVENHSYLHGEDAWETAYFYACNKWYIHIVLYVYKLLACLTHRSRQKWWPRNVVVTSNKGCSISSLLSKRLQLMKSLDPHYWNYISYFAPSTCTHDNRQVSKSTKWVVPANTVACYPWLSLCRVVVMKFTSSGLHTIWGVIPTRHSSCTLCCYRDRLDSSAWSLTIHFLLQ